MVDLGSNSFRLVVFTSGEGWWKRTDEIYEAVRIGEIGAEPTEDTSRAVLVGAGVVWLAIALALVVLTTTAVRERRAATTAR